MPPSTSLILIKASNAKIENTIRHIKEAQAEKERTRSARQELTEFQKQIEQFDSTAAEEKILRKMKLLKEKQERKKEKKKQNNIQSKSATEPPKAQPITMGTFVKIKGQNGIGQVIDINKQNAIVAFGLMKISVKTERLERSDPPKTTETPAKASFISPETRELMYQKRLNFKQDLDIRGLRGDEAVNAVTFFVDDAIATGTSRIRILHGTGNGILRTLIRQYLGTIPGVSRFYDEDIRFGGAGITVVDLK